MSLPSRALLREVIKTCGELESEHAFQCILTYFNDATPMRSMKEVLLRSLGIHVISVASYGHLLSLQGITRSRSPSCYLLPLLFFFFFPELPVVQLCFRVGKVCLQAMGQHRASYRYWIAACFGTHVQVAGRSQPLNKIPPSDLRCERKRCTVLCSGRLALLLLLLAQYLGSIAILYRAFFVYFERGNLYDIQDLRTLEMVLGGAVATSNSICIELLNCDWRYTSSSFESTELSHVEMGVDQRMHSHGGQYAFSADSSIPRDFDDEVTSITKHAFLHYLCQKNDWFTKWLAKAFPESMQIVIEHALAVQRLFEVSIFAHRSVGSPYLMEFYCKKVLGYQTLPPCRLPRHELLTRRLRWSLMLDGIFPYSLLSSPPSYVYYLFYIAIARIVLADIFRLFIWCSPRASRMVGLIHKWIVSGRSLTSFSFVLVGLFFNVAIRIMTYYTFVHTFIRVETLYLENDDWGRLNHRITRFKDPWYDNMYIL